MKQITRFILFPALVGAVLGLAIILLGDEHTARPGFAEAVSKASPAVVNIYSTKITERSMLCRIPAYKDLCAAFGASPQVQNSLGSGVIVSSDGYVVTNNHVVSEADEILVMFANHQTTTAQVIGNDPHTDLAVIKVNATGLPVIALSDAADPQVGDIALAIGNPFGLGHSVSQGIISAFSRTIITNSPYDDFLQTDAAISPGNSGGALVDHEGRLLGINTMIYSQSGGSEGIGFAIPTDIVINVMQQIVEHGRVIRGWLGVGLTPQPLPNTDIGLQVNRLAPGGPAATAGIQLGDVITQVNDQPATNAYSITRIIANTTPGAPINIKFERGQALLNTTAMAGELRGADE